MPDDFKYEVILRHSAKDKPRRGGMRELANCPEKDGLRVWFDGWELKPSDSIPAKIEEGPEQSRVLVLHLAGLWIARSIYFTRNPIAIALAMTMDLTLGIPALYDFLVVRKKQAPAITLFPAIVLSLLIAGFVLPSVQQSYLEWAKKLIPVLEIIVLGFVLINIRTIVQNFRKAQQSEIYATDALTVSVKQALGNVPGLGMVLTEFSLLYFAFGGWFKKFASLDPSHIPFSYREELNQRLQTADKL